MRGKIKYYLIPIFILILAASPFAQRREAPPVEFKKVSDNLYEIRGGSGANGGLYIGDNGVLVIDTKMDEKSANLVFEGIKKLTDLPIKYLVNTHSDGDHIAGNKFFPKSVTIIAHENCRQEFFHPGRNNKPSAWSTPELAPFVPSVTYTNQMDIYLGSKKVELWYFGIGHTKGDTVVYFPEEKAAFLGDQIFIGRAQLIHSYKGGNSFGHVKALSKMLENLDAEKFYSGHSDLIDRQAIKNHIKDMKARQDKVIALKKQGKTLDEVKASFPENEARLVESIFNEIK
jgi:glyoxylase-like metal-dependent hydrolase (beta-lactamase superfamily II)